ncbi:recombination protein NinG [Hydrogenophaga crocea]|uniref:NinG protein n=1 Tax=Hydrogenophaga crocea TaxID=2716225 RepID=A0A6G8IER8_9BURK|nr:recombination protein NinG [Hydrogenophaga crocea]QIM51609.1 ninG protein [Hydrogenophaga crocea]
MTFRRTRCPHCRAKLEEGQRIHPDCIAPWAEAQAAKKEREEAKKARMAAKVDRALTRERKEALKTIPQLIKEAQREFNLYVRTRDEEKPCICCGQRPVSSAGLSGHLWDCGHYRSTGSASHLRFNEDNAHRQLVVCNRYGAGRAVDYRIGLIARIGLARVEALEADNTPKKWTRDELIAIKEKYRNKTKELRKQQA